MADRVNRPIRSTADIPAAMRKVYRRLERWRKTRRGRERIGPQCLCCLSKPSGKDDVALIERPPCRRSGRFTGVVVDADYGSNAQFRAALDRLGLPYGVAIRREVSCAVVGVLSTQSGTAIALSALDGAWESVTWATGTAGPLTALCCALRVRPTKGRGDRWLLCECSATDERKYYLLHLLATAALDLVGLVRSRCPIEQQYRELKRRPRP